MISASSALRNVALDLEDDGEHHRTAAVAELEHQVGAKLDRDELIERGLDHRNRGVRRNIQVKENREEMRGERRLLAEHVDETVVLERRHPRHANASHRDVASCEQRSQPCRRQRE
ncbi:hypothetical protein WMF30_54730 [Sorangium sp. So ce134]